MGLSGTVTLSSHWSFVSGGVRGSIDLAHNEHGVACCTRAAETMPIYDTVKNNTKRHQHTRLAHAVSLQHP